MQVPKYLINTQNVFVFFTMHFILYKLPYTIQIVPAIINTVLKDCCLVHVLGRDTLEKEVIHSFVYKKLCTFPVCEFLNFRPVSA